MIEAYRVGVSIVLDSNAGRQVGQLAEQFEALDRVIQQTRRSTDELAGGLRAIGRAGDTSATAWREATASIERASRAARDVRASPMVSEDAAVAQFRALDRSILHTREEVEGLETAMRGLGEAPAANEQFEALSRAIGRAEGSVSELASGMRGLQEIGTASANAWNEAAASMERAARAAQHGGGAMLPSATAVERAAAGGSVGAFAAGAPIGGGGDGGDGRGAPPSEPAPPRRGHGEWFSTHKFQSAAMDMGIPAWAGGEVLKNVWEATAETGAVSANLQAQGFTPRQVEEARGAAQATQQNTLGTSLLGNLELISKIMAVVQDPEASIQAMPTFARAGVVLDAFGQGPEGNALMDAIRGGEFRGALVHRDPKTGQETVDLPALAAFVNNVLVTDVRSHGQVGPGQILQFMRSAGGSGAMIGDQALFADSMAMIMAMGAANAGRGLQALQMQFSAGKQSDAALNMLLKMGVYQGHRDKDKLLDSQGHEIGHKAGIGQWFIGPQAWADPTVLEKLRDQPAWFAMDYLGPRLEKWVEKNYATQLNRPGITPEERDRLVQQDMMATAQTITSRIPGGKELSEIYRNFPLMERDRAARMRSMGLDPSTGKRVGPAQDFLAIEQQNNPLVSQKGMEAAWKAFEASAGDAAMKPATDALNALTGVLNNLSDWARKNPDGAEHALEGLATGVGMFAAGSAAAAAMAVMTGPAGFVAVAGGIEALGRSFTSIPHWLIDMAAGAAGGARLGSIVPGVGTALGAGVGAAAGALYGLDPLHLDEHIGSLASGLYSKIAPATPAQGGASQATQQQGQPAQHAQNGSIMLQGNVHLHDRVVGTFSAMQADSVARPPAGPTNPDPRLTLPSPGWLGALQ